MEALADFKWHGMSDELKNYRGLFIALQDFVGKQSRKKKNSCLFAFSCDWATRPLMRWFYALSEDESFRF